MYDYYIGGKNHFAADRAAADAALASWPAGRIGLRENRRFLGRAVRYLAKEAGIRQFLDIGSGLPTTQNVHEIAQAADPTCRVVYVDNDTMVLAHGRALLASAPQGRTAYIQADLRSPLDILTSPATRSRCCTSCVRRTSRGASCRPCSTPCRPGRTWPRRT
jgi:hypothetical protein